MKTIEFLTRRVGSVMGEAGSPGHFHCLAANFFPFFY
jgi:hypothetical protein